MFNAEDFAYALGGPEADNPNDPAEGSRGFQSRVANVNHIPVLEGNGVSMVLFNLEPCGINLPHVHPRATEVIVHKCTLIRTIETQPSQPERKLLLRDRTPLACC